MDLNHSKKGLAYIKKIEFNILSRKVIKEGSALKQSFTGIEVGDTYTNGEPASGGIMDPRMGVSDKTSICATCALTHAECPGHFGHMELESPLFHIFYITYIKEILSVICIKCSKILMNKTNEKKILEISKMPSNEGRMKRLINATKNIKLCCGENGCGSIRAKIKKVEGKSNRSLYLLATYDLKNEKKIIPSMSIYPEDCINILRRISDKECAIMGFSKVRPENMIVETLIIPPVPVRPSIRVKDVHDSVDDLTKKLLSIINSTRRIGRKRKQDLENGIEVSNCNDSKLLSQYNYMTYLNNSSTNSRSEIGGKPTLSVGGRLSGKEGRFRNNLLGKRVDYCARTVITPDPSINVDEFRIPLKVAMVLTKQVNVTASNIDYLSQIIKNGKTKYPGANFLFKKMYNRLVTIELHYGKNNAKLKIGDIVARHLQDGDIILVNRQPSLHKLSMLGHYVVISKDPTINSFGLNPAVTTPYNADFDGDEMNIHAPQDVQPCLELEEIACVRRQIITPRDSSPIIGIVQDGLSGSFILSDDETKIEWREAMDIISSCISQKITDKFFSKKRCVTGKEFMSLIIPEDITIETKDISIINGELIRGVLDKTMLKSEKKNNIIHTIWGEYDPMETKKFIDNIQRMVDKFNAYSGFTVGITDINVDDKTKKQIHDSIEAQKLYVKCLTTAYENNPSLYGSTSVESDILNKLEKTQSAISSLLMNTLSKKSGMYIMVKSGAKGAETNICQMAGCLGLQIIDDGRLEAKVNGRRLCCYAKNDSSAESSGFVENSYFDGCEYAQYMIHLMSGRIGIVAKVIGTADTGYKSRKFVKFLEDINVKYDLTVRDAKNHILQFAYGDSCIDPVHSYENNLYSLLFNNEEMKKHFLFDKNSASHHKEMLLQRNNIRNAVLAYSYTDLKTKFNLAFDVDRLIKIQINKFSKLKGSTLDPTYVIKKLTEFTNYNNTSAYCMSSDEYNDKTSIKNKDELLVKNLMKYCICQYLTPSQSITKMKITKECFDSIYVLLTKRYNKNIISAGDCVGIISAQSVGEILTQIKLNTFHSAGSGATTSGLDRLNEVINVTRKIKTPQMILYFNNSVNTDKEKMKTITNHIKYTILEDVIDKLEIIYDPEILVKDNVTKHYTESKEIDEQPMLHWLIRITLDKKKMDTKSVTLSLIKKKIFMKWKKRNSKKKDISGLKGPNKLIYACTIASSNDNDIDQYIHVRFSMKKSSIELGINFSEYISTMIIKGFGGITHISGNNYQEEDIITFDSEGNVVKKRIYSIKTSGINMSDTKYLRNIDYSKTICNDILTIYKYYGIEGARNLIAREFDVVYNKKVAYNNISIIADLMTSKGKIIKIFRSGISDLNIDVLAKASFEKTVSVLINGAVLGKTDDMSCVSSRIMTGLNIKNGTGMVDLTLDVNMLNNSEYNENEACKSDSSNTLIKDPIIKDILGKTITESDIFLPF